LELLTIDNTVVLDMIDSRPCRTRHPLGLRLAALAEAGDVELGVPPQGHRFDRVAGRPDLFLELRRKFPKARIVELAQVSRPSAKTLPSGSLLPGSHDQKLGEALRAMSNNWDSSRCGKGPPGDKDKWYIETHVTEKRDVLLSDDGAVLTAVERLNTEHDFVITAMGLEQYVRSRST
jgi:hypothetical protein